MVFWLLKSFDQLPKSVGCFLAVDRIFQSTEKRPKFWSTDYQSFDQLKKHNFDQLIFGQTAPCPSGKSLAPIKDDFVKKFLITFSKLSIFQKLSKVRTPNLILIANAFLPNASKPQGLWLPGSVKNGPKSG